MDIVAQGMQSEAHIYSNSRNGRVDTPKGVAHRFIRKGKTVYLQSRFYIY